MGRQKQPLKDTSASLLLAVLALADGATVGGARLLERPWRSELAEDAGGTPAV